MRETAHHIYFGEQICKLREGKGWTQKALADKLGKKTSTISAYETNAKLPSADCLIEMAALFGVSLDTLVYGERADLLAVHTLTQEQKEAVSALAYAFAADAPRQPDAEERLRLVARIARLLTRPQDE